MYHEHVDRAPFRGKEATRTAQRHSRVPVLAAENHTLAEALVACGYRTFGIINNPHHHSTSGFWQGFLDALYLRPGGRVLPYARGSQVQDAFLDWYDEKEDDSPYFAYLHFMDVHNPFRPPRWIRRQFVTSQGRDRYINGTLAEESTPAPTDLEYTQALYDGEIRFVDLVLESLVSELAKRDGLDDTLLIITSDHGDEFMDHGGLGHGKHLHRELLHVPLLISGLDVSPRRIEPLVRQIDLAPTLLGLAGCAPSPDFSGRDLHDSIVGLEDDTTTVRSFAMVGPQRSLTSLRWHFTRHLSHHSFQLFDLNLDPGEKRDVAKKDPDLVQFFLRELDLLESMRVASDRKSRALDRDPGEIDSLELDPDIREQLEALGYLKH